MSSRSLSIFLRLPPAVAILVMSAVFRATEGHALPRQTKTAAHRELDVVGWPVVPTTQALHLSGLQRRQEANTVCGYIGGDPVLPATCSAGSHCVLDQQHGVIGCCPDGAPCTTGIFTGCVDGNSGPQTELNPYVFTCAGADVCYRNEFAGGYYQYGCGSASNLGTTVPTSVVGEATSLQFDTNSMDLTETPTPVATPVPIGSGGVTETAPPSPSPTGSEVPATPDPDPTAPGPDPTTPSSLPAPESSLPSPDSTGPSAPTASSAIPPPDSVTAPASPPASSQSRVNTGAIVGGVFGGVAGLAGLIALTCLFLRRRAAKRQASTPPPPLHSPISQYMSPMRFHGAAFAPLPPSRDQEEDEFVAGPYPAHSIPYSQFEGNQHPAPPLRYNPVHTRSGSGITPILEEPPSEPAGLQVDPPREGSDHSQEVGDTSQHFAAPLSHVEDDREPLTVSRPDRSNSVSSLNTNDEDASGLPGSRSGGRNGSRPLWQQNRNHSEHTLGS